MSRSDGKLRVAIVGLRFGGSFPPIYLEHPDVAEVTICDTERADPQGLWRQVRHLPPHHARGRHPRSPEIDAVHLVTPIPSHATLSAAVLQAGKHCACTVPMATTLEESARHRRLQQRTGPELHDDGDGGLHLPLPLCRGDGPQAESLAGSSSCAGRTTRTWRTGPPTGWGCRRCITPRTPSRRC